MLGISRSAISSLMAAGFVSPGRGRRREYRFTFQDVVMLRTAHSLREAKIPGRKILRSLRRLRDTLPSELPLSGLRITAAGNELAVRTGDAQWQVDSGQLLLDFEVRPSGASVSVLSKPHVPTEAAQATPGGPAVMRGRTGRPAGRMPSIASNAGPDSKTTIPPRRRRPTAKRWRASRPSPTPTSTSAACLPTPVVAPKRSGFIGPRSSTAPRSQGCISTWPSCSKTRANLPRHWRVTRGAWSCPGTFRTRITTRRCCTNDSARRARRSST